MRHDPAGLVIRDVGKRFGGVLALKDVSFDVLAGAIHSVIGPNGAGKTCLFNCATGHYKPDQGTIALNGSRIDGLQPNHIATAGVGRTFQNIRLFKSMNALQNVMIGVDRRPARAGRSPMFSMARRKADIEEKRVACRELLEFVGLAGSERRIASDMSYGEQRRLEIARVLAIEPRLVLLDEPAAGMNTAESLSLMSLIRAIREQFGATVVLIEHEMRLVMKISDKITVLDRGSVLAEGPPNEIRRNENVIRAYLGTGAAARAIDKDRVD